MSAAKSAVETAASLQPTFRFPQDEPAFYIAKTFNAPRALVWRAMTDPKLMAQWWGPRRFKTEVKEHDFRVGGKWRLVHLSAGGERHEFFGEFREITAPEMLVQTFCYMEFPPAVEAMVLEDLGEQTRFSVVSRFPTIALRDGMVGSGMEMGARETYERLDELLATLQAG